MGKMLQKEVALSFCFILCNFLAKVELTPIVILPPENVLTTTENISIITTTTSEFLIPSSTTTTREGTTKDFSSSNSNQTKTGESETNSTTTELPTTGDIKDLGKTTTPAAIQLATKSKDKEIQLQIEKVTKPESLTKTESSTAATNDTEAAQLSVTSQPLLLKVAEAATQYLLNESQNVVAVPVGVNINNTTVDNSNETNGSYKDRTPLEYHPYMEEILRINETDDNDTSTQSAPIRIKSKGYQSPQNALTERHPYGPLPKFTEKEINKLRLNHWRVHQILKGDIHHNDHKLGQLAAGKQGISVQGKYGTPSPILGQKRASSLFEAITPALKQASVIDQDEFHSSIVATDTDTTIAEKEHETASPSKLRKFFNWISSPLRRKSSSKEEERMHQAKIQQPILPFALGYRGDFLFW